MKNATIHIVDDDPGMLNYLSDLVSTVDYNAKTYRTANEFLDGYTDDGIGCLVLDLRLPGISGLELHEHLPQKGIDLPVIMISGFGDISTAVKAMKSGVLDFLEKPFKGKELVELIHNAIIQHQIIREKNKTQDKTQQRIDSLTRREKQVMELVVAGNLNKDIAIELGISIKTVEVHRANVMEKMSANSIAELVRISFQTKT